MNITVEEVGPCRKKLNIEFPADAVSSAYKDVVKEYARGAQIQGFRKGKAPTNLVRAKYSKQIAEEVRDRLVPEGYQKALAQEKIHPVAVLNLEQADVQEGQAFNYSVLCDIPPDFELPTYKGIALKREESEVPEGALEEALDRLRDQHATYADVERPVEEGDLVQVNYSATVDGVALDEVAMTATGLGEASEFWVLAEEKAFLPGFSDGLQGKTAGESASLDVCFPDEFPQEALRGLTARYEVDVLNVRCKELPEIDEAFLAKIQVESEESLRSQISEELSQHYAQAEQRRMKGEIVTHLLSSTDLNLPESVVQDETRSSIYQMVQDITSRGASEDDVQENKEQIFETASKTAADKVKIRYILERIADEEEIAVDQQEFQQQLAMMAARQGVELVKFLESVREQNMLENIREDMRAEKTIDFLLEHADVSV